LLPVHNSCELSYYCWEEQQQQRFTSSQQRYQRAPTNTTCNGIHCTTHIFTPPPTQIKSDHRLPQTTVSTGESHKTVEKSHCRFTKKTRIKCAFI
jgi:hypothetical protein